MQQRVDIMQGVANQVRVGGVIVVLRVASVASVNLTLPFPFAFADQRPKTGRPGEDDRSAASKHAGALCCGDAGVQEAGAPAAAGTAAGARRFAFTGVNRPPWVFV